MHNIAHKSLEVERDLDLCRYLQPEATPRGNYVGHIITANICPANDLFFSAVTFDEHLSQKQGQSNKVLVPTSFVYPDRFVKSVASLYRPVTKKGDPRLWFANLKRYCKPTDLLAVVSHDGELFVFNMSDKEIVRSFGVPSA